MKKIFLALLVFFPAFLFAQDVIFLKNGTEVKALVKEVGVYDIRYKRADNPDGPMMVLMKTEVKKIKYENGSTDVFNAAVKTTGEQEVTDYRFSFMPFLGVSTTDDDYDRTMAGGTAGVEAVFPTANLRWSILLRLAYTVHDFNLNYTVPVVCDSSPCYPSYQTKTTSGLQHIVSPGIGIRFQSLPAPARFYMQAAFGMQTMGYSGLDPVISKRWMSGLESSIGIGAEFNKKFNVGIRINNGSNYRARSIYGVYYESDYSNNNSVQMIFGMLF